MRRGINARIFFSVWPLASRTAKKPFRLNARRAHVTRVQFWMPHETAIIVCDMWDDHWCKLAAQRSAELAPRVNNFARIARTRGSLIIHAPSDTMKFYDDTPQRKRARTAPVVTPPVPIKERFIDFTRETALPIVDSDGGCDDELSSNPDPPFPWKQQHPAIEIAPRDIISDSGVEIYNVLILNGIKNVFMTGVHANKCVLARSFGIRQLVMLGINVLLVRDLTDTLYNPAMPPCVSHNRGTDLVLEHKEKHWCPSVSCQDLIEPTCPD